MENVRRSVAAVMLLLLLICGIAMIFCNADTGQMSMYFWRGYDAAKPEDPTFWDKLSAVPAGVENAVDNMGMPHDGFITLYGGFQRLIGCEFVQDADDRYNVVRLKNGYLHFVQSEAVQADVSGHAEILNDFAGSLEVPVLFVLAPHKVAEGEELLPAGVREYGNQEANCFLQLLSEEIDVLDLRGAFQTAEGGYDDYFFRTDHHWTPEGGFLAFQQIASRLETDYGFSFAPALTDQEQYRTELYESLFLGSQGKRVGPWYAGVDDFPLILPAETTQNYSYEIPSMSVMREGSFEDAFIFYEMLERDYYNLNPYAAYMGGDHPLSIARNGNILQGKKYC